MEEGTDNVSTNCSCVTVKRLCVAVKKVVVAVRVEVKHALGGVVSGVIGVQNLPPPFSLVFLFPLYIQAAI